jgi:Uma2 family endonuclease
VFPEFNAQAKGESNHLSCEGSSTDGIKVLAKNRTIPTFEEYLLIDQTRKYIEHFSKTDNKRWSFSEYDESDDAIALSSVSFEISLADIYNNKVNFEQVDIETTPEVGEV